MPVVISLELSCMLIIIHVALWNSNQLCLLNRGGSSDVRGTRRWHQIFWPPFRFSSKGLVCASVAKRHALALHLRVQFVGKKVRKVSWSFQYLDNHPAFHMPCHLHRG